MFVTMMALLAMAADTRATMHPARSAASLRHRRARVADLRAAGLMRQASTRLDATQARPRHPSYRLATSIDMAPGMKSEAVADTGQKCAIIGQALCQHKRRTVFRTEM